MSAHTPGPWAIDREVDADLVGHVCISAKRHGCLAQVVWKMEDDERSPGCEANARLISAAPDLLEALQHILRCIPIGGFAQIHHGSSTWAQIDAAITKAIGDPA